MTRTQRETRPARWRVRPPRRPARSRSRALESLGGASTYSRSAPGGSRTVRPRRAAPQVRRATFFVQGALFETRRYHRRGMRGGLLFAMLAALALFASSAQAGPRDLQHVTLIGDSVADAIPGDGAAVAALRQGIDLDLEVEACRRVDQESCPNSGGRPLNVVQLARQMGSKLGANVVVSVGYNDFEDQYAQNIENALAAFKDVGVKHVWWMTLRAAHHPYINMNDDIESAAKHHPELSVIDWNVYSRSHPDWFQADGLHLLGPGSEAMAGLIHKTLVDDGVALKPVTVSTAVLPAARRGTGTPRTWQRRRGSRPTAGPCSRARPSGSTSRRTAASSASRARSPVRMCSTSASRTRPGRSRPAASRFASAANGVALPDRHLRGLLHARPAVVVGADAAPDGVARLHPRCELRVLRVVGLAVRLPAGRVDRRQPRPRGGDLPRRGGAARARRCSRSPSRSTSGCSATSSTRTSSSARPTTSSARRGSRTSCCPSASRSSRSWRSRTSSTRTAASSCPRRSRGSRSSRRSSRISSPARSCARASCSRSSSVRATRGGSTSSRAFFLIVSGLFLKVVIANHLATHIVDEVFAAPNRHSSLEVLVGVYGYAVQIFADFCGYTNIAIGIALLLGFEFPQNFASPYTAVSLQDFWRRWHMTLSRWLRDYLYIPLGGNRKGSVITYRNLMLTMLLGGLWHGAAWTFVVWGGIHGLGSVHRARDRLAPAHRRRQMWFGRVAHVPRRLLRVDLLPRRLVLTRRRRDRAAVHRVGSGLAARHDLGRARDPRRHRRPVRPARRARRCARRVVPAPAVVAQSACVGGRAHRSSTPSARGRRALHLLPVLMRAHLNAAGRGIAILVLRAAPRGAAPGRGAAQAGGDPAGRVPARPRAATSRGRSSAFSRALHLTTPRHELQVAIGRENEDRIDAQVHLTLPPPAARCRSAVTSRGVVRPHRPSPRPSRVFTAARPLRIWVAGDSLAQIPGQALERVDAPSVNVVGVESRLSTGLARPDLYNWFTRIAGRARAAHAEGGRVLVRRRRRARLHGGRPGGQERRSVRQPVVERGVRAARRGRHARAERERASTSSGSGCRSPTAPGSRGASRS